MTLRRPCYDKYGRCPGWAGSGFKYPKGEATCDNGSIMRSTEFDRWWRWKFHHCNRCDIVVLPYHAHWLAPSYVWFVVHHRWRQMR
jgi:hypothetical protein